MQSILCVLAIFGSCQNSKVPWRAKFGSKVGKYVKAIISVGITFLGIVFVAIVNMKENKLQVYYVACISTQLVFFLLWLAGTIIGCLV